MSDLWFEASADHDLEAREAALARADAEMMPVYSFLFQSRTPRELEHRLAFAATRIERVADATGVPTGELEESARRRYALLKEALPEGVDPLDEVMQAGQGFGSGPAEGYQHAEGPDFSGSYSEIPQGAPGGPDPSVTSPGLKPPDQPLSEPTASLCRCGSKLTKKAKCKACREVPGECMCRTALRATADVTSGSPPSGPPMSGASGGSAGGAGGGMGADPILPAGVSGGGGSPDGAAPGGMAASTAQAPLGASPPGVQSSSMSGTMATTPAQSVTASRDPVAIQVTAVARSVAASNPMLTESECRRVARRVVGGYLRMTADAASGVMSDQPWAAGPGGSGDGSSGASDGSGGNMVQHGLEWQGLKSMTQGGGGGAAAGAGGAAAELGEVAELAAL